MRFAAHEPQGFTRQPEPERRGAACRRIAAQRMYLTAHSRCCGRGFSCPWQEDQWFVTNLRVIHSACTIVTMIASSTIGEIASPNYQTASAVLQPSWRDSYSPRCEIDVQARPRGGCKPDRNRILTGPSRPGRVFDSATAITSKSQNPGESQSQDRRASQRETKNGV